MKIVIGMPTTGKFHADVVRWLLAQSTSHGYSIGAQIIVGSYGHARMRNKVVDKFLETDGDSLFFLDDDVAPCTDALPKLVGHDKPVITGVVPRWDSALGKSMPMTYSLKPGATRESIAEEKMAFRYKFPTDDSIDLEQIKGCGGGCLLVKREVFEQMERPWFDNISITDMDIHLGEDLFFGLRLHELGIPLYVDWSVRCKHYKTIALY